MFSVVLIPTFEAKPISDIFCPILPIVNRYPILGFYGLLYTVHTAKSRACKANAVSSKLYTYLNSQLLNRQVG